MRYFLCFLLALPVLAQDEKTAAAPPEQWLEGSVDIGYRWVSHVGGDFNTWRSVVNLGQGPKLFGLDWTVHDPSKRLFDRLDLRASSWGGDPYNAAQIDAVRERTYHLTFDYRNIAYFNFLPSFANVGKGDERALDTRRRTADVRLDLLPGRRIMPYLQYTRNSGGGTGTSVFFTEGDEFPVASRLRDHTDQYRGGMRMEFHRYHLTLEQGGSTFADDQQLSNTTLNPGNVATPLMGRQLFLTDLLQAYGIRGDSIYSKAIFTAHPTSWINIWTQAMYSRPRTDVNYTQNSRGNLYLFSSLQFYNAEQAALSSEASLPHSSAVANIELRPTKRLRITESWMTDRMNNSSSAFLLDQFLLSSSPGGLQKIFSTDRLVWNYNQQELNLFYGVTPNLTLRGGHRYVYGDAQVRAGQVSPATGLESGELRRHVALAGLNGHAGERLSFHVDFEASPGDRSYFRTSLQQYEKARVQARYRFSASLALLANFSLLQNENPAPTIRYDFLSRQNSVTATWTSGAGKRWNVLAEYARYTLRSNLSYRVPSEMRESALSAYRDNGHIGTSLVNIPLVSGAALRLGGSFFVSSGSRPARFLQPQGGFSFPVGKHLEWNTEWRWYALTQQFYLYEGFRAHQFVTALRLSM